MANLAEQRIETHGVSDEEEEDISPGPSHANENPKLKQAWLEVLPMKPLLFRTPNPSIAGCSPSLPQFGSL